MSTSPLHPFNNVGIFLMATVEIFYTKIYRLISRSTQRSISRLTYQISLSSLLSPRFMLCMRLSSSNLTAVWKFSSCFALKGFKGIFPHRQFNLHAIHLFFFISYSILNARWQNAIVLLHCWIASRKEMNWSERTNRARDGKRENNHNFWLT